MTEQNEKQLQLPLEHIKKGNYIWWKKEDISNKQDCPAIIIKVDHEKEIFSIYVLDKFQNIDDLSFYKNDNISEFRYCEGEEVKTYLKINIDNLEKIVNEKNNDLDKLKQEVLFLYSLLINFRAEIQTDKKYE